MIPKGDFSIHTSFQSKSKLLCYLSTVTHHGHLFT